MPEDFSLNDFTKASPSTLQGDGDVFSLSDFNPDFSDVTNGAMKPPSKDWVTALHDSLTFGDPQGYLGTFNPLDAASGFMGALKKPVDYATTKAAQAMGLNIPDDSTTQGLIANAFVPSSGEPQGFTSPLSLMSMGAIPALDQLTNPSARAIAHTGIEKTAALITDPTMQAFAGGELPKLAHYGMQGMMGLGIASEGTEAVNEIKENGLTPKAIGHIVSGGADALMMALPLLSPKEKAAALNTPEVAKVYEEMNPEEIKYIDRVTKAQDSEDIANQRATTKAGNASDKEYARRVDKLADAQNREDIATQKQMAKPPIELDPLFPEGEIPKENVKLLDKLQKEQEKGDNEERFAEAQKQVKALESGEEEENIPLDFADLDEDHVKLADQIAKAQAREEIANQKNAQRGPIKLDPSVMNPPPDSIKGSEMPVEEEGIKVTPEIQDAVEGFTPKTSIKNLQERLNVGEDEAREIYWKTKKALSDEKQTGNLPLEALEEVYHGSPGEKDWQGELQPSKNGYYGEGIYYTTNKDTANYYAHDMSAREGGDGGRVYKRDFQPKNPWNLEEKIPTKLKLAANKILGTQDWTSTPGSLLINKLQKAVGKEKTTQLFRDLGFDAIIGPGVKNGEKYYVDIQGGRTPEMSHSMVRGYGEHISSETKSAAVNNPAFKRIMNWAENVFPHAKEAAKRAIYGEEDVEKSHFGGGHYDPAQLGSRLYADSGNKTEGNIKVNPWTIAQVAAHEEAVGNIPKGTAHQYFAERLINNLMHENAHVGEAKGPHMSKMDPEGYFNPEGAQREFAFETRHEAIKNDPQVQEALRGILDPKNEGMLKESYEGILKDARKMGQEALAGKQRMSPPPGKGVDTQVAAEDTLHPSEHLVQRMREQGLGVIDISAHEESPLPKRESPRLGGHPPSSPQGQALSIVKSPSLAGKAWDVFKKGVSAGRALTVGGDVSSPFRQSWIQTFSHPIESAKNIGGMFKALSEKGAEKISQNVRSNPYFKDAVNSKLSLTRGLIENKPEEQFEGTKVIEDLLKKGHLNAANIFTPTERAYTQYLNKTRMDSFQRGMELLEGKYGRRGVPEASKRTLAKYVNSSTGRGEFNSKNFEAAATVMNQVLFSPRLLKSRLDVFNPLEWKRMYETEPVVAKMAATEIAKGAAFVGSMVAAASAAGAKVEKDPRSPDFGKIRVGNHTIDPWGGYQQYIRYGAQMLSGERKNQYGQVKVANRGDTLLQFGRSKLAPVPGFIYSALQGKNLIGRRVNVTNPMSYVEAFAPMTFRDIYEVGKTDPVLATAMALPISLGMGVVSREPLPASKEVRNEYERLMVPPPADAQSVQMRNQPKIIDPLSGKGKFETRQLNDKEFDKAKEKGDSMAFSEVEKYISSPSYKALPDDQKRMALNNLSRKLGGAKRKIAAQMVMAPPPQ